MLIWDQFVIIQNLQMSPIYQTSFLVGTFFATSNSKTALVVESKKAWRFRHIFVAFSKYTNFNRMKFVHS